MVRNSKSVANLPVNPLTCLLTEVSDLARAGWKPNEARSPGQAKRHPGFSHSRVSAPCKGRSFNPLCCYSYLIAVLTVLKWNIVCIFCSIPAPCLKAFALTGRDCSNTRYPGCRFACPGLWAPLCISARACTRILFFAKLSTLCTFGYNCIDNQCNT